MRLAVVDIGSNTTLLLVIEKTEKGFEVLADEIYFTRLAENIQQKPYISENAFQRLEKAFGAIQKILQAWRVKDLCVVATSAARQAENSDRLFELIRKYNLEPLSIISGEREAELAFIGSFFGLGHEVSYPLVVDIGGASTEFVSSKKSYSLEFGSVFLTEKFLISAQAPSNQQKLALKAFIDKELDTIQDFLQKDYKELVFTAGTPTTLACMEKQTKDINQIHGLKLTKSHVEKHLEHLSALSVKERNPIPFLPEHRSDVIVAGLSLLNQILERTVRKDFIVSSTGVRYGLVLERFQKQKASLNKFKPRL